MQKKLLWLLVPIGLLALFIVVNQPHKNIITTSIPQKEASEATSHEQKKSIFVPYWGNKIKEGDTSYDAYYYFGIQPTKNGSIEDEIGLQNIPLVDNLTEKRKKLVLRMLDSSVSEVLLQDKTVQETLISGVKNILAKNLFSGLILDIEVPFTLQLNKKEQITKFVQQICTAIKSDYKTCGVLVYGDFLYRNRPYDLKALGEAADAILLMAYDFHKAGGEPGPNFPFDSGSKNSPSLRASPNYGYDFKQMISDVTAVVPKEKIEIVFGMYGYDWTMNEQGTPLKNAMALSLNNIKLKAISLKLKINSNGAKEKYINYTDEEGKKHIIWYEDEESAAVKTEYLEEQGIWQVSFWAQSYF